MTVRILLSGAGGAMGCSIRALIAQSDDYALAGVFERDDAPPAVAADVLLDFSRPEQTRRCLALAAERTLPLVVGTTGLDAADLAAARRLADEVPVCVAANFSTGVAVLRRLVADAARLLDESFDIEVAEIHHRRKVDAPSGTALALQRAAAEGRGLDAGQALVTDRAGAGGARAAGSIGVQALRGGDVAGEHSVWFLGDGERLELTHRAVSREVFARGALLASRMIINKNSGLYDFHELIS